MSLATNFKHMRTRKSRFYWCLHLPVLLGLSPTANLVFSQHRVDTEKCMWCDGEIVRVVLNFLRNLYYFKLWPKKTYFAVRFLADLAPPPLNISAYPMIVYLVYYTCIYMCVCVCVCVYMYLLCTEQGLIPVDTQEMH